MGEEKLGQGKENVVSFIENNPELAANIEKQIRELVFPGQVIEEKKDTEKAEKKAKGKAAAEPEPITDGLF